MAGSAGGIQTPARVQLLQLQRPRSLVELRHREDERRLLGFRRRQLRRPQRGGAPASGANRLEPPRYLRRNEVADPPRRARPIVINPYRLPTVPSSRQ